MNIRWRRIIIASTLAEILSVVAVLTIVPLVLMNGISTIGTVQQQMQNNGLWVGPISGFALCLVGGWWAGRKSGDGLAHGIRVGVIVASIELVLLLFAGAPIGQFLLTSIGGRLLGGYAGGRLASRSHAANASGTVSTA